MTDKTGKIVFYSASKEFGFIKPDGSEGDVFFHITQYDHDGEPAIDTPVAFQVEDDPRREGKQRARTVVPIQNLAGGLGRGTSRGAADYSLAVH
jgi:cold shock CspA family protein